MQSQVAAEYVSIDAFVQFCVDDERDHFTHEDLMALNFSLRRSVASIRQELEGWGLQLKIREPERRTRGFTSSSHDRWFGPGSCKTHGGSGAAQICGWAKDGMIRED